MTWLEVLLNYENHSEDLRCPQCGHKLSAESTKHSVTFVCNSCRAWRHIDKVRTEDKPSD